MGRSVNVFLDGQRLFHQTDRLVIAVLKNQRAAEHR
jgi:hypothetical protein